MLKLEKAGEIVEVKLETANMMQMAKSAKKIAGKARAGWTILEVSGTDEEKVAFMRKIASGYKPGAREMMSEAGLQSMPGVLKKFFKDDEAPPG